MGMLSKPHLIRNRYVLVADLIMILVAAWGAFSLRFGWFFLPMRTEFATFVLVAILVKPLVFASFGLYRRYWRYASIWDLMAVVVATVVAAIVFTLVMVGIVLLEWIPELPRSVIPLDWLLTLALATGVRASVRIMAETAGARPVGARGRSRRTLIVGAGDAGALVAREMQRNPQGGLTPVAFLDDEPSKLRKRIYGVPVLGALDALDEVVASRHVDEVVIALPRSGGAVVREIVDSCRLSGIPFRVMPGIYELLDGQFGISRLREVDIADLLRRPQVAAIEGAASYVAGGSVLITGAGGSIGGELARQVAHAGPKQVALLGHGENSIFDIASELRRRFPAVPVQTVIADIRDRERLLRLFQGLRPDVVFHAAAHKHVPLMEENIAEAITNNVLGSRNVVDAASAAGAERLVLVSTDKAVAPTSVMGASKRVAEMIVRAAARRESRPYAVVRFGNVLGSRGSVVPLFKGQIERGGPVTVTHPEVKRYFMTIPEAVHLVLQAGGLGRGGELFVLDMGQPVLLRDLAADMIRLSGFGADEIPIVYTGLRAGEKLDEVLWEEGADVIRTAQPDIRLVHESEAVSPAALRDLVDQMIDAAGRDEAKAVRLLKECIPTSMLTATPEAWGSASDRKRALKLAPASEPRG
jgi:FlaA1/EpsC-like NDP-sugar epimerase